jgi:hypothetical protein
VHLSCVCQQRHFLDATRIIRPTIYLCLSQWPRCLRRRSAAAWLLGSRVRIPLGVWMFVSCVYMLCCPVRSLRRADHSSRGVLPCVCMHVIKKPRKVGQMSILDYKRLWMNEYVLVVQNFDQPSKQHCFFLGTLLNKCFKSHYTITCSVCSTLYW